MQQELGKESTDYDEQHNNDQKSTTNLPNLPISMRQWPQQLPQPFPQRFWRDIEQMAKNNSVVILPQEKKRPKQVLWPAFMGHSHRLPHLERL